MSDWEGEEFEPAKGVAAISVQAWSDEETPQNTARRGGGDGEGGGGEDVHCVRMKIPSSCDRDVVISFLDNLDLRAFTTMASVRELRDYLLTAFNELVTSERDALLLRDRGEREKQSRLNRESTAKSKRVLAEINKMLNQSEAGQSQVKNMFRQLHDMRVNEQPQLNDNFDEFMVPRSRPSRERQRSSRWRGSVTTSSEETEKIRQIKDLYMASLALYSANEETVIRNELSSEDEIEAEEAGAVAAATAAEPFLATLGAEKFPHWLSENFMQMHTIRLVNMGVTKELHSRRAWPDEGHALPPAWLDDRRPRLLGFSFLAESSELMELPAVEHGMGYTSIPAGSLATNVAREQQSQNRDTTDIAYFSRYGSCDQDDGARIALSSTPITPNIDYGLAFHPTSSSLQPDEENTPMMTGSGSARSLPAEVALVDVDSGNQQSMGMSPAAEDVVSTVARSRPGVTPFRPLLPVIDEEHRLSMLQRLLKKSFHPPPDSVETTEAVSLEAIAGCPPEASAGGPLEAIAEDTTGAAVAVGTAPITPPHTPRRDWSSIFRPRDQIPSYVETRNVFAPRNRRPRRQRKPETPPGDRLDEQPRLNHEITTNFMANLLQRATEMVRAPLQLVIQSPSTTGSPTAPDSDGVRPHMEVLEEPMQAEPPLQPAISRFALNAEATDFPPALLEPSMPEILPNISENEITNMDVTDARQVAVPMQITNENRQPANSLADLSVNAIVTDVQILPPWNMDTGSLVLPAIDPTRESAGLPAIEQAGKSAENLAIYQAGRSTEFPAMGHAEGSAVQSAKNAVVSVSSLQRTETTAIRRNRQHMEDMAYIAQHTDMLRVMLDHQKYLSDQQHPGEAIRPSFGLSQQYRALIAVETYDPHIILNMPISKVELVHGLLEALIMLPRVDLQNAPFIKNRINAARAFRFLLDLQATGIVKLSDNGRFCWLL
ncbi:sister chromatid cohesion protein solo-like [Drosophila madeirensis]|uniref:Sister chromatid cohesion protein solo-like n=1 Tax=Drosophila madeirensis TaxID=30013 RepID=A0AAU9FC28_DROMD